ncbi:hypothetical protein N7536_008987 [Penicillium majusculum]|uniref:Uncharacterized protein n=1 Tax=Penicillium solitum TaxID=60172 RepID=A0A1V6R0K2_9EURO|nr:uncharacterized protein PENSOL_c024G10952 [Penicillium solitum]KAJ5686368.1 hypothetical protein N7536_008987 [Penicillium majusculum]OQD94766.1 hypothetical protein PENSOL_c024G10952 [Penicillium solitum]
MFPFDQGLNFMAQAGTWAYETPALAACAVAGTGGVVVVASPVLVTAPILSGLGFNTGGVAAGSYAAGVQSSIGNVVANSLFATGQSAGAGGLGSVAVNTAAQACGALTGMGSAGFAWFKGNGTG